jgi:hypothetical protein
MTVVEDHVPGFRPARIVLALRSDEHTGCQKRKLADRIASETGLPPTVLAIDAEGRVRAR